MSIARLMQQAAAGAMSLSPVIDDVFSTDLYTGNGSTQTITNGIDLSGNGGLVWLKARSFSQAHGLFDTERGENPYICTNLLNGQFDFSNGVVFNSDGFTNKSNSFFGGSGDGRNQTYASWTFRKAPRFFDVVTYTGTGSARTVSHNLGLAPGCIFVKRTNTSGDWQVYHRDNTAAPETDYLVLNSNAATVDSNTRWNDTAPTDGVFTVGAEATVNASGGTYVAYLFAHDPLGLSGNGSDGLIACGSYTGNGSATGPSISLGWEPQWLMIKRSDSTGDWWIYDNERSASNPRTAKLRSNSGAVEDTSGEDVDFISTGFQPKSSTSEINASGGAYIYMAIRVEGA